MRRRYSFAVIALLLAACASSARQGALNSTGIDGEGESDVWSDVGTVASGAGQGALFGTRMTAELMQGCQGDGCALGLLMGVILIPVGAVIGTGVGLVEVAVGNDREKTAARWQDVSESSACPAPDSAEWLRECQKVQGPIPRAVLPPADRWDAQPNPAFDAWFDACGAALEIKLDANESRLVPAMCRSDPVPSWWRVNCLQKTADAKEERRFQRALFQSQRSRYERDGPFASCSLT